MMPEASFRYLHLAALACFISAVCAANVLVVLAGADGARPSSTDEYDDYWTPTYGNTPFLNADQTGSSFTVVPHDSLDDSIFENTIDSAFDAVWYFKTDDDWDDEEDKDIWVANLEAYANTGKLVVITGMDVIASEEDFTLSALAGGSGPVDGFPYVYDNYDRIDSFSSDVGCAPMLDGPFGTFYGTFPDFSGFRGLNDTDGLGISFDNGDEAIACLTLSDSYLNAQDPNTLVTFDEVALFSVRPMQQGGVIAFMTLSFQEYDNIGDGFYGAIVNNLLSFATTAGGGGDPHMLGFDKTSFDLMGHAGQVYNIISDSDLQMNVMLWSPQGDAAFLYNSFIGSMAFMTDAGDSIVFDAGDHDTAATVTINGQVQPLGDMTTTVNGRSFAMERSMTPAKVPMALGLKMQFDVSEAVVVRFERYALEVYVVRDEGDFAQLYFMDFTVTLLSSGHAPHGLVGRTLMVNGQRQVREEDSGTQEDFLVADGLLGCDFRFNRFE